MASQVLIDNKANRAADLLALADHVAAKSVVHTLNNLLFSRHESISVLDASGNGADLLEVSDDSGNTVNQAVLYISTSYLTGREGNILTGADESLGRGEVGTDRKGMNGNRSELWLNLHLGPL